MEASRLRSSKTPAPLPHSPRNTPREHPRGRKPTDLWTDEEKRWSNEESRDEEASERRLVDEVSFTLRTDDEARKCHTSESYFMFCFK